MTPVEFLESRITTLIPEDIGSQLMYKSNIKKAKAMETVESMRVEKLEVLAKLLAKTWFHGNWKWETPNERVMQMLMQELGYYPFKDEDEMIQQTQIDSNLYKQAANEIKGWSEMSKDISISSQTEILDKGSDEHIVDTNEMIDQVPDVRKMVDNWDNIFDKIESEYDCHVPLKVVNYLNKYYKVPTSSQTEISDEEMMYSEDDVCNFVEWMNLHYRALEHTISLKDVNGTKELLQKWYREQLKNNIV